MTDIVQLSTPDVSRRSQAHLLGRPRALAPYACVVIGSACGLVLGRELAGSGGVFEPRLALLLHFMAAMKFAAVLGAAVALHWRSTYPLTPKWTYAYGAALLVMAPAPGLIFSLGAVVTGAVLFHVGALAFLVLALKDDGLRLPVRRRAAPPATEPVQSAGSRATP